MNKCTTEKLVELVQHNKQMLKDAEAGNWEKVAENEVIREQLIKAFYSLSADADEAATVATATQELLHVNEEITQLAREAKEQLKNELCEIGRGKSAVNAYTKHMR